ncbi:MAG: tetratricopeptide repeat protein [Solirubrobacterales bacterium]|nr:tetratricopeptide repeat protein [Solirubrobacterales bacterium]
MEVNCPDAAPGQNRKALADAFNALARYSLAVPDDDTLSIHRLLQKVIRDELSQANAQQPYARAMQAVIDVFPADSELPARWPLCEQLLPHALALADTPHETKHAVALAELLGYGSWYLICAEPGRRRAVPIAELTHEHARRLLGAQHHDTLNAGERVALAYRAAGRTAEAIAIHEPLLADSERLLGAEHPNTLSTRNNLALAYQEAGRTAEAIAIHEPLLADRERLLGAEHPDTLGTRNNLANAYRAAGRTTDAERVRRPQT